VGDANTAIPAASDAEIKQERTSIYSPVVDQVPSQPSQISRLIWPRALSIG
jgi:hypothetical protein